MKPPKYGTNSIVNFKFEPEILYGKFTMERVREMKYDLMDVVLVFLSTKDDEEKDELCGMLETLFDRELKTDEKLDRLESDYDMKKTVELRTEVTKMCDYSIGIARDSYLDGQKKGREDGRKEGRKEGQNLLVKAIQLLRDGKSDDEIKKDGVDEHTLELAKACQ